MTILRKTAVIFVALIGLVCILYGGVWILVQTRQFQSWIEASARDAGIDLRVAALAPVFPFGLVISSPEITIPAKLHFTSKEIRTDLNPLTLMFGDLKELTLLEPKVRINLTSSSEGGEAPSINLLLRSFVIKDGQLEVDTGNGNIITMPRIQLSGENLNLGSQSGEMATTAFIPELNGDLAVRLNASPSEIKAKLELVQHKRYGMTGSPDSQPAPKSQAEVALHFDPDAGVQLTARATLEQVALNAIQYTGSLKLNAVADSNYETITIDLQSETTNLTGLVPSIDMTHILPLSTKLEGHYTTTDNELTLARIRSSSPLGTVKGRATLVLDKDPRITSAILETQAVALAQIQRLMPGLKWGL